MNYLKEKVFSENFFVNFRSMNKFKLTVSLEYNKQDTPKMIDPMKNV